MSLNSQRASGAAGNSLGNAGASILGTITLTSPVTEKHTSNLVMRNQMQA